MKYFSFRHFENFHGFRFGRLVFFFLSSLYCSRINFYVLNCDFFILQFIYNYLFRNVRAHTHNLKQTRLLIAKVVYCLPRVRSICCVFKTRSDAATPTTVVTTTTTTSTTAAATYCAHQAMIAKNSFDAKFALAAISFMCKYSEYTPIFWQLACYIVCIRYNMRFVNMILNTFSNMYIV